MVQKETIISSWKAQEFDRQAKLPIFRQYTVGLYKLEK